MDRHIVKSTIINTLTAAAGDIDTGASDGWVRIKGLDPMPANKIVSVTIEDPVTEVVQAITWTPPTIVASTTYGLTAYNSTAEPDLRTQEGKVYRAQMDATLVSAAADKELVIKRLGHAMMADADINKWWAGLRVNITHAAGNAYTLWEKVSQAATGAYGIMIGTTTIGGAPGVGSSILVQLSSADFTTAGPIVGQTSGASNTPSAATLADVLVVVDQPGYDAPNKPKRGVSVVLANPTFNTASSQLATTVAGVKAKLKGADLLQMQPIFAVNGHGMQSGDAYFPTNDAFAAVDYSKATIVYMGRIDKDVTFDSTVDTEIAQTVYYKDADAAKAAWETALGNLPS